MSEARALPRRIGLGGATLLSFNSVVGSAIFALPATLAADLGSASPWLFVAAGLAFLAIAIPYARAVAAFTSDGGPAVHGAAFGRIVGFELGWVYYISRAAAFAANVNVLASYAGRWWAPVAEGWPRIAFLLLFTALLVAINVSGVRRSIRFLGAMTFVKAIPLVLLAFAALVIAGVPAPGPMPAPSAIETSILLAFYAFVGFENATVAAGETRESARTIPRALLATVAATALLYFLVQLAFVAMLPGGATDETAPLVDLGAAAAGPAGALVITLAALASLTGNLHSNLTATPRVTLAFGERGDLPRWFAAIHPRFATPANSTLFLGALAALLAVSGSYVWLAVVSTLARMFVYSVTIAALPRVERRLAAHWWAAIGLGLAVCIWAAAQAEAKAWITLGALAVAGALLYAVARRRGEAAGPA